MSEEIGVLYPQTSELLKLSKCLHSDCNKVGDEVIIKTKFNTVRGIVAYIDNNGGIKVSYKATDAGYTDCYVLEQCDVISIRCYNCCDDRYFELENCDELTCDIISAALGASSPKLTGNIYLYSGDPLEPDCLWKWNGLNDIGKPENWIDQYGALPAQFENLNDDQLNLFLTWLSAVFSGAGISFNVSQYGDSIVVTVGDGSETAPASFSFNYSQGRISLDPNDGSGRKDAMVVVHGDGPPTEPYGWFFYVNDLTNGLFVNVGGSAKLVGFIDDPVDTTCAQIVSCVAENIQAGPIAPDQYAITQLVGPDFWVIGDVVYGEGESPSVVDFEDCSAEAETLDELIGNLNACNDLPENWLFTNSGGVLVLCVPVGTHILTIQYDNGSGFQVVNFNGVPTTAGGEGIDLIQLIINELASRDVVFGNVFVDDEDENTSAVVESTYNPIIKNDGAVFWKIPSENAIGKSRLTRASVKDKDDNWQHLAYSGFKEHPAFVGQIQHLTTAAHSENEVYDISGIIPDDATFVDVRVVIVSQVTSGGGGNTVTSAVHAISADDEGVAIPAYPSALPDLRYLRMFQRVENSSSLGISSLRVSTKCFRCCVHDDRVLRILATFDTLSTGGSAPTIAYTVSTYIEGFGSN